MKDLQILKLDELSAYELQSTNAGYYSVPSSVAIRMPNFNTEGAEEVLNALFSSAELLLSVGGIVAEYY